MLGQNQMCSPVRWQRTDSSGLHMTFEEFRQSFTATEPPAGLTFALAGLWWDAKGDWQRAHEAAQQDEGRRGFVGSRVPASQRRRSGQRRLLVQPSTQARLPGAARYGVA
jgi:hypothetical protein